MPFELHNKKKRAVECCIRGKWGSYKVPGECFFPSIEEEKAGLTADLFNDFVPKLLSPTPPPVRRRLLVAAGLEVPEDVIKVTSHLAEFGGSSPQQIPAAVEKVETSGRHGQETVIHEYIPVPQDEEAPQRPERRPAPVEASVAPPVASGPDETPEPADELEEAPVAKETSFVPTEDVPTPTLDEVTAKEMGKISSRNGPGDMTKMRPGSTHQALDQFADAAEEMTARQNRSNAARRRARTSNP